MPWKFEALVGLSALLGKTAVSLMGIRIALVSVRFVIMDKVSGNFRSPGIERIVARMVA